MATSSQNRIEEIERLRRERMRKEAMAAQAARAGRGSTLGGKFRNAMSRTGEAIARVSGQASKYADELTGIPNVIGGTTARALENVRSPEAAGRALGSAMAGTIGARPVDAVDSVDTLTQPAVDVLKSKNIPIEKKYLPKSVVPETGVAGQPMAQPTGQAPRYLPPATYGGVIGPQFSRQRLADQAASFGIKRTGENEDQKLTRLYAQLDQTRDTKKRANIQNQINVIESGRVRGEQMGAQQQLAETAAQAEIAKAVAGNQVAMANIQAKYATADSAAKADIAAAGVKGIFADDTADPADKMKRAQEYLNQLSGGTQQAGQAVSDTQMADTNGDGKIDPQEKAAFDRQRFIEFYKQKQKANPDDPYLAQNLANYTRAIEEDKKWKAKITGA